MSTFTDGAASEKCGRERVEGELTRHWPNIKWIQGKATGQPIQVCYGKFGSMDDFHVIGWYE